MKIVHPGQISRPNLRGSANECLVFFTVRVNNRKEPHLDSSSYTTPAHSIKFLTNPALLMRLPWIYKIQDRYCHHCMTYQEWSPISNETMMLWLDIGDHSSKWICNRMCSIYINLKHLSPFVINLGWSPVHMSYKNFGYATPARSRGSWFHQITYRVLIKNHRKLKAIILKIPN